MSEAFVECGVAVVHTFVGSGKGCTRSLPWLHGKELWTSSLMLCCLQIFFWVSLMSSAFFMTYISGAVR